MARKPWREVSARNRNDPERIARVESGARAMLVVSALTELRESRGLTQADVASAAGVSQARISQIEHQGDLSLSTLDGVVRGIGGHLRISVDFPDETVELLGPQRTEAAQPHAVTLQSVAGGNATVAQGTGTRR
jgi:transcriptional regulator with XRE-family HTH domain